MFGRKPSRDKSSSPPKSDFEQSNPMKDVKSEENAQSKPPYTKKELESLSSLRDLLVNALDSPPPTINAPEWFSIMAYPISLPNVGYKMGPPTVGIILEKQYITSNEEVTELPYLTHIMTDSMTGVAAGIIEDLVNSIDNPTLTAAFSYVSSPAVKAVVDVSPKQMFDKTEKYPKGLLGFKGYVSFEDLETIAIYYDSLKQESYGAVMIRAIIEFHKYHNFVAVPFVLQLPDWHPDRHKFRLTTDTPRIKFCLYARKLLGFYDF